MPVIYIVGDSTVDNNEPPFRGWGWALPQHTAPGVTVENHAKSGRSSKSFLDEGRFDPIRAAMQPGDLLLIQFGHNDEKDDAERHTDPDTTFPEHLSVYIDAALEKGATPVLITPVCRRYWAGNDSILYTHGEYALAIRRLAAQRGVALLDLKKATRSMYLALGPEESAKLFVQLAPGEHPDFPNGHDDHTHSNAEGAARVCALLAELMKQNEQLAHYLA